MKIWRIKLIGYDLYYQPVKGRWSESKTNISPRGKVYITKPTLKHIGYVSVGKTIVKKYDIKIDDGPKYRGNRMSKGYGFEVIQYDCVEENA